MFEFQSVHTAPANRIAFPIPMVYNFTLSPAELMGDYTDRVKCDSPFITEQAVHLSLRRVNSL